MLNPTEIVNIILHVILIATFIAIFFFTYASKVEQVIVQEQVDYIVRDLTSDLIILPKSYRDQLRAAVDRITVPDMSAEDNEVIEYNRELLKKVIKIVIGFVIIGLVVVGFLVYKYNLSVKDLFIKNLVVLLFIAATEYIFLTYLASHYQSGDPNFAKLSFVKSLRSLLPVNMQAYI